MAKERIEDLDRKNEQDVLEWPIFGTRDVDDAEEIRDYLVSAEHFCHIDEELTGLIRPYCPEGADRKAMVRFVADKLVALDAPQTPDEEKELVHKTSQMVRHWFSGDRGEMNRESAIKLCFALGLNDDQCNEFLTRSLQMPELMARKPEEQICIYFLHNAGRQDPPAAWAAKEAMVQRFEEDTQRKTAGSPRREKETGLGDVHNTTHLMRSDARAAYRDAGEFYQEAMLGRREDYIYYSKTITWAYYDQKLRLIGNIIARKIEREQTDPYKEEWREWKLEESLHRKVRAFLKELPEGAVDVSRAFDDKETFQAVWKQVEALCKADPEELLPKIFQKISFRKLLRCTVGVGAERINEELRSPDTAAGGTQGCSIKLPLRRYIENFERDYKNLNDKFYVRQAIMIFFTLNYLYEWEENGIEAHCKEYKPALNRILAGQCGLAGLNHGFPLDWLLHLLVFQYGYGYGHGDEDRVEPRDMVAEVFSVLYQ